eukprot:CAMPEP_0183738978 /NCGR_PEP_ID=MMETSP0737-20130205/55912_1 /TAXON_ID=385413 /ORGANISM="Thalassiosira miniscula, Strain CCMP1093" /LENGTH=329 /DNA_ID=CAMNT_0025973639 /DNA_START=78 /DNA_END=1067 /DNA_ORIENTATION=+
MAGPTRRRIAPDQTANRTSRFYDDEITSPLLVKDGGTVATSVGSDERVPGPEAWADVAAAKPTAAQIVKSLTALLISAAGAAASVASFILSPAVIVYVAGSVCLLNLPMVTYKEIKLLLLPSQGKAADELQEAVDVLQSESAALKEDIEYLMGRMDRFGDIEEELQEIVTEQGSTIDRVLELVRENEATMDYMRENLRQKVVEDVLGIILTSEKANNQEIDKVEAKLLALKITVKLEAYGITFDEDKFLRAVAMHPTLWGAAQTVQKLLPRTEHIDDNMSAGMSVGTDENDVYDMFYMANETRPLHAGRGESEVRRPSLAMRRRPQIEA